MAIKKDRQRDREYGTAPAVVAARGRLAMGLRYLNADVAAQGARDLVEAKRAERDRIERELQASADANINADAMADAEVSA
jgi:hypothetical protein